MKCVPTNHLYKLAGDGVLFKITIFEKSEMIKLYAKIHVCYIVVKKNIEWSAHRFQRLKKRFLLQDSTRIRDSQGNW